MATPHTEPYGSWKSPISSKLVASSGLRLGNLYAHDRELFWCEGRASSEGKIALIKWDGKQHTDQIAPPYNVRTRVHEYGGFCYTLAEDQIYFSNFSDNQLYLKKSNEIHPLTNHPNLRFAEPTFHKKSNQLFLVVEDHANQKVENSIYTLSLDKNNSLQQVISGHDFYSSISLSPNGKKIAWICWNHPNMPWDGTELWIANIDENGSIVDPLYIAGNPEESISEARWSPSSQLYFLSDRSGYWNLYRKGSDSIEEICQRNVDFGQPEWVLGSKRYVFSEDGTQIYAIYTDRAVDYLCQIDLDHQSMIDLPIPYTRIDSLVIANSSLYFLGASPTSAGEVVEYDLTNRKMSSLQQAMDVSVDPNYISNAMEIEFETERETPSYAFYYPPKNREFVGKEGEKPPLLVLSHGGPTAHSPNTLNLKKQYFTSRGFAVVDVNYGGSSGFGRAYRQRLNGNWGITDVGDCIKAADFLVQKGLADPNRIAISGGSAGGYTTLAALTFHDFFKAGASYYGVSDLRGLVEDTHKFESHYLDSLIGKFPLREDLYESRSPILHTEKLSCPVLLLQGDEDAIVPPSQSEKVFEALKKKGIPTAYLLFQHEQHGFRDAKNIARAIETEFAFYSRVFNFSLSDSYEPFKIENEEKLLKLDKDSSG